MKYVKKTANRYAEIVEADSFDYTTIQKEVGGCFECLRMGDHIIYLNDIGKMVGLPLNFVADYGNGFTDQIVGDIVITKHDGFGGDESMTDDEAKAVCDMFNYPDQGLVYILDDTLQEIPVIDMRC